MNILKRFGRWRDKIFMGRWLTRIRLGSLEYSRLHTKHFLRSLGNDEAYSVVRGSGEYEYLTLPT